MTLPGLAARSLLNRRASAVLTVATIAIAIALVVLVEQMRLQLREGFYRSVSGTDLIVGAPTSPVQLLLFSVFGIGNPSANLDHDRYLELAADPLVEWAVPIALGDAYRGYRVVGTSAAMFERYRYAGGRALLFAEGAGFDDLFDAVAGAAVARRLGLAPGDAIVLAHGGGNVSLHRHEAQPFRVSGVLAATGTPVDQAIYIRIDAHHAVHIGWERGMPEPARMLDPDQARALLAAAAREHDEAHEHAPESDSNDHATSDRIEGASAATALNEHDHEDDHEHQHSPSPGAVLEPSQVSAVLLGLKTRASALGLQYRLNQERERPLLAILPGLALQQLWRITGLAEQVLRVVSGLVVLAGLMGMLTALLGSLAERRREMAILRACGARPWQVAWLLLVEAGLLTALGIAAGLLLAWAAQLALAPWLLNQFGIALAPTWPAAWQWLVLAGIWVCGLLVALLPAVMVYRRTLNDGMQIRS
ncbi:MAG: peptide ABC transporter permease [Gammaproteobacteria bacterium HGW-Gammaproteobacteria-8]|nr:MAG: peptide ABC transporter permease [Gammaproteobacteria bacterium HGW-Gammaproteobacteria-8]